MSHDLNRFGFHYFNDTDHYTQADWALWGSQMTSLDIRWMTLKASERRAIPEFFLRAMIDDGIQPIIHIPAKVGSLSLREIAPLLKSYADWGVQHVVIFDKPNAQTAWNPADWSQGDLVERFTDILLPILHVSREVGLKPMLPPLEPGGDYWDTAFLEAMIGSIVRRGQTGLLNECGCTAYAWTYGRPLSWGQGGPQAWPLAKPYQSPAGSQNHIGFRIFEWYQALINRNAGFDLPIYIIAGGYSPGVQEKHEDPVKVQTAIFEFLQDPQQPEYLKCFNFDAFSAEHAPESAWFTGDASAGPMAEAIIERRRAKRKSAAARLPKTIEHYALLPGSGTQDALEMWKKLADFAFSVQPTFGFSVEEASRSKKVTILGNRADIPTSVEERLADSGCDANRIDVHSEEELIKAITDFSKLSKAGGEDE